MKKLYNKMNLLQKCIFGFLVLVFGFFFGGIISYCSADEFIFSGHCGGSCEDFIFSIPYVSLNGYGYHQTQTISNIELGNGNLFQICCTRIYSSLSSNNDCKTLASNYLSSNSFYSDRLPLYCKISFLNSSAIFDYSVSFSGLSIQSNYYYCGNLSSSINVLYNDSQSVENVICDGDNIIQIDGYSTITSTNKFTPYFNINYRDEDNQLLTESYDKSLLILSGGNFKKTYTGDNERIFNLQESVNSDTILSGFIPNFVVTGSTDITQSGNMFNNFSDNALKVLLSNIPSYIQYFTIFAILLFLFGFLRRFKRKR